MLSGYPVLHAPMAVEVLGRRQNPRFDDGPGRGHLFRNRKETEEEAHDRLLVGKPQVPQLVGLQVLFLRTLVPNKRYR